MLNGKFQRNLYKSMSFAIPSKNVMKVGFGGCKGSNSVKPGLFWEILKRGEANRKMGPGNGVVVG